MQQIAKDLQETNVAKLMADDYCHFALSTFSRSLPNGIDGLKLVQRRAIQIGLDAGYTDNGHPVKLTRWAGDLLGRLHPHADASYSILQLANVAEFANPLVLGFGNLGGISSQTKQRLSNDGPASARYLKACLSQFAEAVFDIPIGLLHTQPNYDATQLEILQYVPALPLAVLNGQQGISTGFATNMPSYNLLEIANVLEANLLKQWPIGQAIGLHVPGPDFVAPGCKIAETNCKELIATGRGTIWAEGNWAIEQIAYGKRDELRDTIVITGLPSCSAEGYATKVADCMNDGQVLGIVHIRDLSTMHGMRLELVLGKGIEPGQVANQLLKYTPLREAISFNNTVLIGAMPKQLGLAEMLTNWLDARKASLKAKFELELNQLEAELHILSGLLKAIAQLDDVIATIRASEVPKQAIELLQNKFGLDEAQAKAIMAMSLSKLVRSSSAQLAKEIAELQNKQNQLNLLINSTSELNSYIAKQIRQLAKQFGQARFVQIVPDLTKIELAKPAKVKPISLLEAISQAGAMLNQPLPKRQLTKAIGLANGKLAEERALARFDEHVAYWQKQGQLDEALLAEAKKLIESAKSPGKRYVSQDELASAIATAKAQCQAKRIKPVPAKWLQEKLAEGHELGQIVKWHIDAQKAKLEKAR